MQSPAQSDINFEIQYREKGLLDVRDNATIKWLQAKVDSGTASPFQLESYQGYQRDILNAEGLLQECKAAYNKKTMTFAKFSVASGFRKIEGKVMDWALGEPSSERIGGNLVNIGP